MSGRFIITPWGIRPFKEALCNFHKVKWKGDREQRICLSNGVACSECLRNGANLIRLSGGRYVLKEHTKINRRVVMPFQDYLKPLYP